METGRITLPHEEKDRLIKMYEQEITRLKTVVYHIRSGKELNEFQKSHEPSSSEIKIKEECLKIIYSEGQNLVTTPEIINRLTEKFIQLSPSNQNERRKLVMKVSGVLFNLIHENKIGRLKDAHVYYYGPIELCRDRESKSYSSNNNLKQSEYAE